MCVYIYIYIMLHCSACGLSSSAVNVRGETEDDGEIVESFETGIVECIYSAISLAIYHNISLTI